MTLPSQRSLPIWSAAFLVTYSLTSAKPPQIRDGTSKHAQEDTDSPLHSAVPFSSNRRWINTTIPYLFGTANRAFETAASRAPIMQAFQTIMDRTCLNFTRRDDEKDYIYFYRRTGNDSCHAYVGKWGGKASVHLGKACMEQGTILHEIMHALGFHHEHSRSDRDDYVTVNDANVKSGRKGDFEKKDTDNLGIPYDHRSIMHYGAYDGAIDNSIPTIVPKGNVSLWKEEEDMIFSEGDIEKINRLFRCAKKSKGKGSSASAFSSTSEDTRDITRWELAITHGAYVVTIVFLALWISCYALLRKRKSSTSQYVSNNSTDREPLMDHYEAISQPASEQTGSREGLRRRNVPKPDDYYDSIMSEMSDFLPTWFDGHGFTIVPDNSMYADTVQHLRCVVVTSREPGLGDPSYAEMIRYLRIPLRADGKDLPSFPLLCASTASLLLPRITLDECNGISFDDLYRHMNSQDILPRAGEEPLDRDSRKYKHLVRFLFESQNAGTWFRNTDDSQGSVNGLAKLNCVSALVFVWCKALLS